MIPTRKDGPPAGRTYSPPAPSTPSAAEYRARQRRYNTAQWRRLRLVVLSEEPLCRRCQSKGLLTPATQVHHIVDVAEDSGRFFDRENLEPLCAGCHSSHTRKQMNKQRD